MVFNSSAEIFSKFKLFHRFWFKVAAVAEAVEMSSGLFTVPGEGPFPFVQSTYKHVRSFTKGVITQ